MEKKVVKCTRCKHTHSSADRVDIDGRDGWFHSSCPKCSGRITIELTMLEYEIEVSKQQKRYPALKGEEIRPDWIHEAFKAGTSPIEFLNGVISDCF